MITKKLLVSGIAPLLAIATFLPSSSAASLVVVNAASLTGNSVAPGSIISIFGSNLAQDRAAVQDAANPPQTLGSAQVTIGGVAAFLFYVSPGQINAVVSPATPLGTQSIVVTSPTGTSTGTINIDANAAPGLFSALGTGTGDGAILNALTFQSGAFSTVTSGNPTYIALFATGLNLSVAPTVTIGGVDVAVSFYGNAPCCRGLQQINVQLPSTLAGAGRVAVVLHSGTQVSNVVEIVILPPAGQGEFPDDGENDTRSREISALTYIPGTSLALISDENDDVIRVLDISQRSVSRVIALPDGAQPEGIAITADGSVALVAEAGTGRVAIINLKTFTVTAQITVGVSPISVAIAGNTAFIVNQGNDTLSVINLGTLAVVTSIAVGRGPSSIAIDAAANRLYVANQNAGTISTIDLSTFNVISTTNLGAIRPASITLSGTVGFAIVMDAATGHAQLLNLSNGNFVQIASGVPIANSVVIANGVAYFANQTAASVTILPFSISSGMLTGSPSIVKAGLGVRSLAVDTKDNLLLATDEGAGLITLIDLTTMRVVGSINAVKASNDDQDDHGDRNGAPNLPVVTSISPAAAKAGTTFTLTVNGKNLNGATEVIFVVQSEKGNGNGKGDGNGNGNGKGRGNSSSSTRDTAFTVTNVSANAAGTQVTVTVAIAANAAPGTRVVRVLTANGDSTSSISTANTFTVQ